MCENGGKQMDIKRCSAVDNRVAQQDAGIDKKKRKNSAQEDSEVIILNKDKELKDCKATQTTCFMVCCLKCDCVAGFEGKLKRGRKL